MPAQITPEHFLVDKHGKPEAVVLSFVDYEKLLHLIEDLEDTVELKRAIHTSRAIISHTRLIERLKRQQLL